MGALLTCLHFTDEDRQAEVLAKCSKAMRDFSTKIDFESLNQVLQKRGRKEGNYHGGLVRGSTACSQTCSSRCAFTCPTPTVANF